MKTLASWEARFEEPSTVHMKFAGFFMAAHIEAVIDEVVELRRVKPIRLQLADVSRLDGIDSRGRKAAAMRLDDMRFEASALYGASVPVRAAVNLILGAANLLGRLDVPAKFFAT